MTGEKRLLQPHMRSIDQTHHIERKRRSRQIEQRNGKVVLTTGISYTHYQLFLFMKNTTLPIKPKNH